MKITRRQLRKVIEEAHGLSKDDVNYVKKVAEETEDEELKRILKFIAKSNVEVDVTQDVTKMKKEAKMKITHKQLRQIIKEELGNTVNESVADMAPMDILIEEHAGKIVDAFGEAMESLWDEDTAMMKQQGYTDRSQWDSQVGSAKLALEKSLEEAITKAIQEVEMTLHSGGTGSVGPTGRIDPGVDSDSDGALDAGEKHEVERIERSDDEEEENHCVADEGLFLD